MTLQSKHMSHREGSFEYPQHRFWMKILKKMYNHPEPAPEGDQAKVKEDEQGNDDADVNTGKLMMDYRSW